MLWLQPMDLYYERMAVVTASVDDISVNYSIFCKEEETFKKCIRIALYV